MYENLLQLNLEGYIKKYCGGAVTKNKYLKNLDLFIGNLSEDNLDILKNKFKGNKEFSETSNLLREIEIALLFHPQANFRRESGPDLEDNGTLIEVKSINEGKEEAERHTNNSFFSISTLLSERELKKEQTETIKAVKGKLVQHLEKAHKQINSKGLIYIIWDYNTFIYRNNGQVHKNGALTKNKIGLTIKATCLEFNKKFPEVIIRNYYFADIINMIETR